jgi:hypothetical protein
MTGNQPSKEDNMAATTEASILPRFFTEASPS